MGKHLVEDCAHPRTHLLHVHAGFCYRGLPRLDMALQNSMFAPAMLKHAAVALRFRYHATVSA
jgi:hypothetical protein